MTTPILRSATRPLLVVLCFALAALALPTTAAGEETAGKPRVVKIHADWCGTCVRLEPTWEALEAEYGDTVEFVVFDVTDEASRRAAKATAGALGLEAVLARYGGSTGRIVILPATGAEPTAVLEGKTGLSAYTAPIARARAS